jgi:hypothetical protein
MMMTLIAEKSRRLFVCFSGMRNIVMESGVCGREYGKEQWRLS